MIIFFFFCTKKTALSTSLYYGRGKNFNRKYNQQIKRVMPTNDKKKKKIERKLARRYNLLIYLSHKSQTFQKAYRELANLLTGHVCPMRVYRQSKDVLFRAWFSWKLLRKQKKKKVRLARLLTFLLMFLKKVCRILVISDGN